ncbi:hypothetical protein FOZ60_000711 [Perkinsus olseni]|uniref:Uncharacterized protein n=1 Tax=Perkinsus olseni TaxID=32597 RepID=A0A7J6P2V0_PEROL|nr:hypothetical protein FOZ60_000711 [Perkinsus olseni]
MSFIAILAHGGGGNNRRCTTTRPIPTLSPTTCPTAVVSTPLKPTGGIFERPGQFVYQTHGPNMFSIQCGTGAPYQTNWIDPIPGSDDHDRLIAEARAACPLAGIGPEMHYNVSMDGTVAVILSCATGGTGFKKFKLVGTGIGNPYKVEPMDGGETLKDLVDTLKWV